MRDDFREESEDKYEYFSKCFDILGGHSDLALDMEAIGAHQTLNSSNWESYNNIIQLFIISVLLEADSYLNLFQGSVEKLQ